MKRIKPRPTLHTFIIIPTYPLQSFNITSTDIRLQLQILSRSDLKLLPIVFLLIVINIMFKN
jgi:hypothetical protein